MKYTISIIIFVSLICCHNYDSKKEQVIPLVLKLDTAFHNKDTALIKKLFPAFTYRKMAFIRTFLETPQLIYFNRLNDNNFIAIISHGFDDSITLSSDSISLYLMLNPLDTTSLIFKDSKNLFFYGEDFIYKFAERNGCIDLMHSSDVKVSNDMLLTENKIRSLWFALKDPSIHKKYPSKENMIETKDQYWKIGSGDYASGSFLIANNTGFQFNGLNCELRYMDKAFEEILTDKKYVGDLDPFQTKSISFYTSYVPRAHSLIISAIMEEQWIEYMLENEYFGCKDEDFKFSY